MAPSNSAMTSVSAASAAFLAYPIAGSLTVFEAFPSAMLYRTISPGANVRLSAAALDTDTFSALTTIVPAVLAAMSAKPTNPFRDPPRVEAATNTPFLISALGAYSTSE